MITIGFAFMNRVVVFYTFYRYIRECNEFLHTVTLIHFQLELFWTFLVGIVIRSANQVTKEVKYICFSRNKPIIKQKN